MNKEQLALSARIRAELDELDRVVGRAVRSWQRAGDTQEPAYIDSVALNLHAWYSGLERVFSLIASVIDQARLTGDSWHHELLRMMSVEIEGVRPAVLTRRTSVTLDPYRGFRHVVRNVYSFLLSPERIEPLVTALPDVHEGVNRELMDFAIVIEAHAKKQ